MPKKAAKASKPKKQYTPDDKFTRKGRTVVIRAQGDEGEIVMDGTVHAVRFLDNGRPYTRAFVNVMATSVRDLAERFVDVTVAQEAHWAEIDAARAKAAATD